MTTRTMQPRIFRVATPLLLLLLSAGRSLAGELIFSQSADGQAAYGPSSRAPDNPRTRGQMAVLLAKTFQLP
jgi:hypothetical protein